MKPNGSRPPSTLYMMRISARCDTSCTSITATVVALEGRHQSGVT
eukprot:CAMPEP_0179463252 /NCGR_PEP_ID=MMETSP0799-20121207/45376_1 /TAXON_ID=46947 /ORGANISM="Geminigera cryophila, Strain CCMP2564" /LENGTH=44 /DNA_ID= /DNA_START= /DNA_END= /DNA_ORIENTATION=